VGPVITPPQAERAKRDRRQTTAAAKLCPCEPRWKGGSRPLRGVGSEEQTTFAMGRPGLTILVGTGRPMPSAQDLTKEQKLL